MIIIINQWHVNVIKSQNWEARDAGIILCILYKLYFNLQSFVVIKGLLAREFLIHACLQLGLQIAEFNGGLLWKQRAAKWGGKRQAKSGE